MSGADVGLHPGPLELLHYVRGTLASGHAAVILAHCLVCDTCASRLAEMLSSPSTRAVATSCGSRPGSRLASFWH